MADETPPPVAVPKRQHMNPPPLSDSAKDTQTMIEKAMRTLMEDAKADIAKQLYAPTAFTKLLSKGVDTRQNMNTPQISGIRLTSGLAPMASAELKKPGNLRPGDVVIGLDDGGHATDMPPRTVRSSTADGDGFVIEYDELVTVEPDMYLAARYPDTQWIRVQIDDE